jgi:hypothetical protein
LNQLKIALLKENNKIRILKWFLYVPLLIFPLFSNSQYWKWVNTTGGYQDDNGECTAIDQFGNIYLSGYFRDTLSLGSDTFISAGNTDIFIVKYSPSGEIIWAKRAGGTGEDNAGSIAVDSDGNVYTGGWFNNVCSFDSTQCTSRGGNDMFLSKYNNNGSLQWVFTAGGTGSDKTMGLTMDGLGNCLVSGFFNSTFYFGSNIFISQGSDQVFVAKFTPSGTIRWVTQAGFYNLECWPSGIGRDGENNIYIAGSFKGNATFGNTTLTATGTSNNIFVAKLDSSGNFRWAKTAPSRSDDYCNGIIADDSGYVSVTGSFFDTLYFPSSNIISAGSKDGFVLKYDSAGTLLWAHNIGGINSDKGIEIAVDNQRNTYVTGFINGTANFNDQSKTGYGGDDIFIAKYDHSGNIVWVQLAGGSGNDYGMGTAVDKNGNLLVTGSFQSASDFGSINRKSSGMKDIFIAKLTKDSINYIRQATVKSKIIITPNPAHSQITLQAVPDGLGIIEIMDVNGSLIFRELFYPGSERIDISGLKNGLYLIKIVCGTRSETAKFIKED